MYVETSGTTSSRESFGTWLMEHFGHQVVSDRRARERGMRALRLGPPVVLEPIVNASSLAQATAEPVEANPGRPSTGIGVAMDGTKPGVVGSRSTPSFSGRLLAYMLVAALVAYAALWFSLPVGP